MASGLLPAPLQPSSLLTSCVGLQVFHCHFNSNFFPLFLEHLLSDHISLSTGSFLLGEWVPQAGWEDRGVQPSCRHSSLRSWGLVRGAYAAVGCPSRLRLCFGRQEWEPVAV